MDERPRKATNDSIPPVSDDYDPTNSASGRDLLVALPLELAAECFRQLDLRGCIVVSHVSRAWRLAALDDRSLWNQYYISRKCRNIGAAVDAFSTLLARSHPLPFRFVCDLQYDIPSAINDLVLSNLDRIAELTLNDGHHVAQLMHHNAPLLQHLTCRSRLFNIFVLPAQWGALNAPRLQHLTLCGFKIPSDCRPFTALRELNMVSRPDGVFGVPLSHVFPNLTSLKLRPVTQQTLPMLLPLVPALEIVHLLGTAPQPIDYSHFFRSISMLCRIHELQIHSASRFVDALELFVRVHDGPWTLTFGGHHVSFYGDAVSWDIESHSYILQSLAEERDFVLHLERLAAFELPLALFVEFVRIAHETPSGAWTRQLPHLRALTLLVDVKAMFHSPSPFFRAADAGIGIGMPALEAVEFRCADTHGKWDFGQWIADVAPVLLAELLGSPRPLARVVIRTKHSYEPSRQDVAHLLQHAERVLVCAMVEAGDAQLVFERSTAADSICDALED